VVSGLTNRDQPSGGGRERTKDDASSLVGTTLPHVGTTITQVTSSIREVPDRSQELLLANDVKGHCKIMESFMRITSVLGAIAILGFATAPAFADDEYYIVQDKGTMKCTIVKEKPTEDTMVIVDEDGYATEVEAVEAQKKVKVCVGDD
jgi:hypothetical protein